MDGGAWWAAVHGLTKSWTQWSDFTFTFHFHALEKAMATHSSVLAWRIPGLGEPGGLPSMGSHRVGHNWNDLAAAAAMVVVVDTWIEASVKPRELDTTTSEFYSKWKDSRMCGAPPNGIQTFTNVTHLTYEHVTPLPNTVGIGRTQSNSFGKQYFDWILLRLKTKSILVSQCAPHRDMS